MKNFFNFFFDPVVNFFNYLFKKKDNSDIFCSKEENNFWGYEKPYIGDFPPEEQKTTTEVS